MACTNGGPAGAPAARSEAAAHSMYVVSDQGKVLARYDERTGVPLGQRRIGRTR
jgi:hypothetical protein